MSIWRSKSGLYNLGIIAIVFGILGLVDLPDTSYLWQELHNFGHTPLFGVLALAFLRISRSYLGDDFFVLLQYFAAGIAAFILGLVWELLQIPTAGDADPVDLARNAAGILGILSISLALDRPYWSRRETKHQKKRTRYFLFGGAVLIIATIPLMVWAAAYIERDNVFPQLSRLDTFLGRKFLLTKDCSYVMATPPDNWLDAPAYELPLITLKAGTEYPGVELADPIPDWTNYSYLQLDIYSPADTTITLVLSIEDHGTNREVEDRYNERFQFYPGLNRLEIDLGKVEGAPLARRMNMANIARIKLFGTNLASPTSFYLADFHLR